MLGRRDRRGEVAYPEGQNLHDEPTHRLDEPTDRVEEPIHRLDEPSSDLDKPDHYDGPVHRRDESELRPANIDGTPPGVTPEAQRAETQATMPKPGPDLVVERTLTARGGLMPGPVITGMVVAFGAMAILTALIAALFIVSDTSATEATRDAAIPIGVGVLLVLTQFASYFWGGYTAGRMARGAGVLNGLAVPLVALLLTLGTGAILSMMGTDFNFSVPVVGQDLNIDGDTVLQVGVGLGVATLVAMILGGILGGVRGARWHNKLESGQIRGRREEI